MIRVSILNKRFDDLIRDLLWRLLYARVFCLPFGEIL